MLQRKGFPFFSLALWVAMASPQVLALPLTTERLSILAQTPSTSPVPTPFSVPAGARVLVDGSESLTAVNQELKQRYEESFPGATVELATNGSQDALQALRDGNLDIAAIGRVLTQAERAEGLQELRLPREKIAIMVGPDNPFKGNLTFEQFARIFRGDITDWSELGGPAGAIRFVDQPESSDTRLAISQYDIWESLGGFQPGDTVESVTADRTDAIVDALGSDGIGYAVYSQVGDRTDVTILPMHQTLPDNPAYPYSQPRVLVHRGDLSPASQAFLALASGATVVAAGPNVTDAPGGPSASPGASNAPDGPSASPDATDAPGGPSASPGAADAPGGVPGSPGGEAGGSTTSPTTPATPTPTANQDPLNWLALLLPFLLLFLLKPFRRATDEATAGAVPKGESVFNVASMSERIRGGVPDGAIATGAAALGGAAVLGGGAAALAGLGGPQGSRIRLTARDGATGYASWEAPAAHREDLRQQGGQDYTLRIYDVTGLAQPETADLSGLGGDRQQDYTLAEADQDRPVPLQGDRDYLAEIGYRTEAGGWLALARSSPIRLPFAATAAGMVGGIPATEVSNVTSHGTLPNVDAGAVAAGLGAVAGAAILGGAAIARGKDKESPDLETDDQSLVEAAKFDVGQTDLSAEALADVDVGLPDLPDGYGQSRIVLLPRDPQWAYAYWDAPDEHKQELRRQGGQRLALRLYDVTDIADLETQRPHSLLEYDCDELARDWYLGIPVSDRDYLAEIGYLTAEGHWLMLARSNRVRIPPIYPSDWYEEHFLTLGWSESLHGKTFLQLNPPGTSQDSSPIYSTIFDMTQAAEAQRVSGSLFGSMHQVPGSVYGSAQMASGQGIESFPISSFATQSGIGMMGAGAALGMGLGAIPTFSGIGMSGVGMSEMGLSGMNLSGIGMSGAGLFASMPPMRSRKFWLVADAELIVYGATEPDATVYINGQPIALSPDGTFRFQMSFQDGQLDFPIMAVASDGEQTRAIRMNFNRETPYRQTNTKDEAQDESY